MKLFLFIVFLLVLSSFAEEVPLEFFEESVGGEAVFEYPLLAAARDGDLNFLREQLRENADVNYQNEVGWTALIYAVEMGNMEIFNELIDHGANVNMFEQDGWSALMFAAFHGNNDMVIRILNVGGDPLHMNNAGYASHSIAFNQGQQRTGEMIADAGCIAALNIGDYISAIALIREGASVNVYNPQGWTPLIYAIAQQFTGDAEILLRELGADPNQAENDGWSPLMFAVNSGNLEMVRLLLDFGANVAHASSSGIMAMDLASDRGDPALIDLLAPRMNMTPADEQPQEVVEAMKQMQEEQTRANVMPAAGGTPIPSAKAEEKQKEEKQKEEKKGGFRFW